MKKKILDKTIGIGQMIVTFLIYAVVQGLFMIRAKQLSWVAVIFIFGLTVALLSLIYGIYQRRLNQVNDWHFTSYNKTRMPRFTLKNWSLAFLGFLVICILQILAGFLIKGEATNQANIATHQQQLNPIINVMLIAIGPLFEEIIFRGIFFNWFFSKPNRKSTVYLAVLVNGIVFGLIHEPQIDLYTILYSLCGSVLALVYLETKDLTFSYVSHLGNNLAVFLISSL
ncbi:CPBP family intramembrane glutamic endopeptidase [Lactobacillus crispatus]|uniref:CPBP family intramembrane glutamic endopeptidase n=1 Tax=Lactobacillus crispatus TaxID=47770 RepID=UPI0012DE25F2|nr:type II CAAX endopeptidase family protein [Lactobacillus crispatus]MDK7933595.1 type II CAAX endopeptidase family protein [Lactobacillus crispatus]QGS06492.1 CPBP family intramembrane metalloprotease [Lactobacillus crispatus]